MAGYRRNRIVISLWCSWCFGWLVHLQPQPLPCDQCRASIVDFYREVGGLLGLDPACKVCCLSLKPLVGSTAFLKRAVLDTTYSHPHSSTVVLATLMRCTSGCVLGLGPETLSPKKKILCNHCPCEHVTAAEKDAPK